MDELLLELISYVGEDYSDEIDPFLKSLLKNAIKEVTRARYKGHTFQNVAERKKAEESVLINYDDVILKIAEYHYDKQGNEGVLSYSESGSSFSYENAGTPQSYLSNVIPITRIMR